MCGVLCDGSFLPIDCFAVGSVLLESVVGLFSVRVWLCAV